MFIKTAHNRLISSEATAWLKKMDSQNTICKLLLSYCRGRFYAGLCCVRESLNNASREMKTSIRCVTYAYFFIILPTILFM